MMRCNIATRYAGDARRRRGVFDGGACRTRARTKRAVDFVLLVNASPRRGIISRRLTNLSSRVVFVFFVMQAIEKFNVEKDIAAFVKKEFDRKHGQTWHCIVGRNFGSYVTHESGNFIYFYLGKVAVLLFKAG